jgi:hypothetical protein
MQFTDTPFKIRRSVQPSGDSYVELSNGEWYQVTTTADSEHSKHAPIRDGDEGIAKSYINSRYPAIGFRAPIANGCGCEFTFLPRSADEIPSSIQGGPIDGPRRID